jgi:hypothetical protein
VPQTRSACGRTVDGGVRARTAGGVRELGWFQAGATRPVACRGERRRGRRSGGREVPCGRGRLCGRRRGAHPFPAADQSTPVASGGRQGGSRRVVANGAGRGGRPSIPISSSMCWVRLVRVYCQRPVPRRTERTNVLLPAAAAAKVDVVLCSPLCGR